MNSHRRHTVSMTSAALLPRMLRPRCRHPPNAAPCSSSPPSSYSAAPCEHTPRSLRTRPPRSRNRPTSIAKSKVSTRRAVKRKNRRAKVANAAPPTMTRARASAFCRDQESPRRHARVQIHLNSFDCPERRGNVAIRPPSYPYTSTWTSLPRQKSNDCHASARPSPIASSPIAIHSVRSDRSRSCNACEVSVRHSRVSSLHT